uniref:Uncharacterized protein n=1 Tax=Glossina austeni TaxID=7395 RepID=A0A1A9UZM9_GLOAU
MEENREINAIYYKMTVHGHKSKIVLYAHTLSIDLQITFWEKNEILKHGFNYQDYSKGLGRSNLNDKKSPFRSYNRIFESQTTLCMESIRKWMHQSANLEDSYIQQLDSFAKYHPSDFSRKSEAKFTIDLRLFFRTKTLQLKELSQQSVNKIYYNVKNKSQKHHASRGKNVSLKQSICKKGYFTLTEWLSCDISRMALFDYVAITPRTNANTSLQLDRDIPSVVMYFPKVMTNDDYKADEFSLKLMKKNQAFVSSDRRRRSIASLLVIAFPRILSSSHFNDELICHQFYGELKDKSSTKVSLAFTDITRLAEYKSLLISSRLPCKSERAVFSIHMLSMKSYKSVGNIFVLSTRTREQMEQPPKIQSYGADIRVMCEKQRTSPLFEGINN